MIRRVALALAALAALLLFGEWRAEQKTFLNCWSDVYAEVLPSLGEYQRVHGRLPESWPGSAPLCREARAPLLLRPAGYPGLLVMCPPRSHGFLRRWALGVMESGKKVRVFAPDDVRPWRD